MTQPLDELYLNWLYGQIADVGVDSPSRSYWNLATLMYRKEFFWFVPNDDNRAEDGKYLRCEFIEDQGWDERDVDPDWMALGCSMLELLVGLSRRLSFQAEGEPREWFWVLINNLGLRYNDRRRIPVDLVEEVLDNVIWRTYGTDGHGGLFPLDRPRRDQREVEIWFQMSAYLLERD